MWTVQFLLVQHTVVVCIVTVPIGKPLRLAAAHTAEWLSLLGVIAVRLKDKEI